VVEESHGRAAIIDDCGELDKGNRFSIGDFTRRLAAASMIFNSTIAASPSPSISRKRSGRADTASAKDPNRAIKDLASGFTSRRGMARN